MTDRPKISLPKGKPTGSDPSHRRTPVRGAGSAPRKRPTAAEAEQARQARQVREPAAAPPAATKAQPARTGTPAQRRAAPTDPRPRGDDRPSRDDRPRTDDRERPAPRPASPPVPRDDDGRVRLSKRMGELGLASRREADEWIARGWVRVDGQVVSELGSRIRPEQAITVDPKARAFQAQLVTILLNKPMGYVSGQAEDGYEPASVLVVPANHWKGDPTGLKFKREHLKGLAPAGRLDIDSVGLLVLTQDGRVAKRLIGEDSEVDKEYLVRVEYPAAQGRGPLPEVFPAADLQRLNHGLELDGRPLRPAEVRWQNDNQLRFVLREGRKRQIRRMCEAVGLKVVGLKRIRIGRVMLGDLPAGQWRYLRGDESF